MTVFAPKKMRGAASARVTDVSEIVTSKEAAERRMKDLKEKRSWNKLEQARRTHAEGGRLDRPGRI